MENIKETILQSMNIEYITDLLGKEPWVQVSGKRELNGADAAFWCGLVQTDHIGEILDDFGWDISNIYQSTPGFVSGENGYCYEKNTLGHGLESILYYREFYGVKPDYIELSQEFILLNNLRYDPICKSYLAMYESGESEEAVKYINETTVLIKLKFLRNYSSAKQMAIVLYFDIRTKYDGQLKDYGLTEFNTR